MELVQTWFSTIKELLTVPLFHIGKTTITLWSGVSLILLLIFLFYGARFLRTRVVEKLLEKSGVERSSRQAAGVIVQYIIIIIGFLIIIQTVGIDITTLNVLAGAIGIGVGFGLQNIANNLISGLIILFERPVKVGDRIEVGDVEGAITKIGTRSTTVLTNDNIAIIIPNSRLISENVVNWSYNDENVRFKIPVSVSYGSDVRKVEQLLLKVASENPDVLENPTPRVRFVQFGDSGLTFTLLAWTRTLTHRKGQLISDLNFSIFDIFKKNGIEIPFPQRDLHIRSGDIVVKKSD